MLTRRRILRSLLAAPVIISTPGLLMRIRPPNRHILLMPQLLRPGLENWRGCCPVEPSAWFIITDGVPLTCSVHPSRIKVEVTSGDLSSDALEWAEVDLSAMYGTEGL